MSLFALIASDLRAKAEWCYESASAGAVARRSLLTDGTPAMVLYRLMQWSRRWRLAPLEMLFNRLNSILCNCIIGRGAEFGPRFVLVHATGVVVNGSVRGGSDVYLEHQVTIGAERRQSPVLGDGVFVGAGREDPRLRPRRGRGAHRGQRRRGPRRAAARDGGGHPRPGRENAQSRRKGAARREARPLAELRLPLRGLLPAAGAVPGAPAIPEPDGHPGRARRRRDPARRPHGKAPAPAAATGVAPRVLRAVGRVLGRRRLALAGRGVDRVPGAQHQRLRVLHRRPSRGRAEPRRGH